MFIISFPDTLSSIGNSSFEGCSSLIEVEIPDGVSNVGLSAFSYCTSLESVKLPLAINGINKECFCGCSNLAEVYIYENILAINENAFGSCENISNIYFNGSKELWDDIFVESGNDALSSADLHYKVAGQDEYLVEHVWMGDYTIDKDATCTVDGTKSKHCINCDEITDVTVIPQTGHKYSDWTVTKEATCTEDGSKEKVCSACGDKVTETIPSPSHQWNTEPTVDKPATYSEEGSQSIHCSVCDEIQEGSQQVIPMLEKLKNTMTAKAAKKTTVKYVKVKKKAITVKPITVKNPQGTVSYKLVSGNAKSKKALKLNTRNGKVTVKKKTAKGTYKIKVKVSAAGTDEYKAASKNVNVTVVVN